MRYRFTQRKFFSWLRKAKGEADVCSGRNCLLAQFLPTVGVKVFHVYKDKYEEILAAGHLKRQLPRWATRVISRFDRFGIEKKLETLSMRQSRRLFAKQMKELA